MTTSSSESINLTSPLYARQTIEGEHSLRQMGRKGKLNIRGDGGNPDFIQCVKDAIGIAPPTSPHQKTEKEDRILFWLGPNEWLLYCNLDSVETLEKDLKQQLKDIHHGIIEVSDYYTVVRLRGPQAEKIIRRGCPLDLHHSVFHAGDATQTRFGHASILLHKLSDGESWDIQVRWSYAEYLWDYLVSAIEAI